MSPTGNGTPLRVLVVGSDAQVSIALHIHLDEAGHAFYCVPSPADLESLLRVVAPHVVVLLMPGTPDGSWGSALTAAQTFARAGTRVIVVAPSREIVEPLATVAGAERALARAQVLSHPLLVLEREENHGPSIALSALPPQRRRSPLAEGRLTPPALPVGPVAPSSPDTSEKEPSGSRRPYDAPDLMALIDEELVDEPRNRLSPPTRVEVNVSLVSEHNFYVGPTRRIDSGGVFISSAMPPPRGTHLSVRLGLADGRKVDLEGEVTFRREKSATLGRQPTGCGVKLYGLPAWAVDAIDRFILARQPVVYEP